MRSIADYELVPADMRYVDAMAEIAEKHEWKNTHAFWFQLSTYQESLLGRFKGDNYRLRGIWYHTQRMAGRAPADDD